MKKNLLLIILSVPLFAIAQNSPTIIPPGTKHAEAQRIIDTGYTAANGWTIKPGDTFKLGKGSMPNKTFTFVYQSPIGWGSETSMDNYSRRRYAGTNMTNKDAKVKSLITYGVKKSGYTVVAKVGLGDMVNYWVEIDNAIDAGEIVPPVEYAKKDQSSPSAQRSVADELKKLKELLDSGALTQDEYNAQKKKILSN